MAGSITVAGVTFDKFVNEDLPSTYLNQAELSFSQFGVAYTIGPAKKQRRIWTISAYATPTQVRNILSAFRTWDANRESLNGLATVTVSDSLLSSVGADSSQSSVKAFFTTPPQVSKVAASNNDTFIVTFGLTEVGY